MENENQEPKEKITDAMIIAEWRSMLDIFKEIIKDKPKPEDVKEELIELIESAKVSGRLTPRQLEGIRERCMSYINGTYGKNLSRIQ